MKRRSKTDAIRRDESIVERYRQILSARKVAVEFSVSKPTVLSAISRIAPELAKHPIVRNKRMLLDRFWEKVNKTDGCWEWTGSTRQGYGQLLRDGTEVEYAHRVSYEINVGPIPDGMLVCHHCDNRLCVNPSHLFVGTYQDNSQDMISKFRGLHGEKCHAAKLKDKQVIEIRSRYRSGENKDVLTRDFGITREHLNAILRGYSWRHIL